MRGVASFIFWLCVSGVVYAADTPLHVTASIAPVAYFVERIGGDRVLVNTLVGSGQSPHTFEPTPHQIGEVSDSRLFIRIGEPFEDRLLQKITSIAKLEVVDMSSGLTLQSENHAVDPHIWLSPVLMNKQIMLITDALCRIDSVHSTEYRRNLAQLTADLQHLDSAITVILAPYAKRNVYVYHAAFGYFCEQYHLEQVAVEQDGKEPSGKWLTQIIEKAKADHTTTIFAQPQYLTRGAQTVADEIDARIVMLDPNAHDYIGNLLAIAQKIAASFAPLEQK